MCVCVNKYTYMTNTCPYAHLCTGLFFSSVDVLSCKMDCHAP